MALINVPCKDCKDRVIGCHAKCEKYAAYKVKLAKYNKMCAEKRQIVSFAMTSGRR